MTVKSVPFLFTVSCWNCGYEIFSFVESQPDAKKMASSNDRKLILFSSEVS